MSCNHVIYSQSSLKYSVYSGLPLSPSARKVDIRCHSDNEFEVPDLLRLTPIPGYAGTFPVRGESEQLVHSQML